MKNNLATSTQPREQVEVSAIKQSLNPENLLNPGQILPECAGSMSSTPAEAAPLSAAFRAQIGGGVIVILAAFALVRFTGLIIWQTPLTFAILQAMAASSIAIWQRAPRWWVLMHLGFMPLVVVVSGLGIAPGWFLGGFVLLLLVYWRTDRSRVPLYLTNHSTAITLATQLPYPACRVLDLGCGDGGLLRQLALARPDCSFVGIEHAPLPWLMAKLRTRQLTNVTVRHGDFWREPLRDYGLVYAFLSPAPMPRLWEKARTEMLPGTTLVSNSFAVPEIIPETVIEVGDRRATRLYLYCPNR